MQNIESVKPRLRTVGRGQVPRPSVDAPAPGLRQHKANNGDVGSVLRKPSISHPSLYSDIEARDLGARPKSDFSLQKKIEDEKQEEISKLQAELEIARRLLALKNSSIGVYDDSEEVFVSQENDSHQRRGDNNVQDVRTNINKEVDSSLSHCELLNKEDDLIFDKKTNIYMTKQEFYMNLNTKIDMMMEMMSNSNGSPVSSDVQDSSSFNGFNSPNLRQGVSEAMSLENLQRMPVNNFSVPPPSCQPLPSDVPHYLSSHTVPPRLEDIDPSFLRTSLPPSMSKPNPHSIDAILMPNPPAPVFQDPLLNMNSYAYNVKIPPPASKPSPSEYLYNPSSAFNDNDPSLYEEDTNECFESDSSDEVSHNLVREQEQIMLQIQAENRRKKEEESLSLKLIEDLKLQDQGQGLQTNGGGKARSAPSVVDHLWQQSRNSNPQIQTSSSYVNSFPALGSDEGWIQVGSKPEKVKVPAHVKLASLKAASEIEQRKRDALALEEWRKGMLEREEEEKRRLVQNTEKASKVRFIKEVDKMTNGHVNRAQCLAAAPLGSVVPQPQVSSQSLKKAAQKHTKAAKKSEEQSEEIVNFERERKKAAEELKRRLEAQVCKIYNL